MSTRTIRMPAHDKEAYLSSLNACFGHWGGEALWRWVFERDVGEGEASRMVIAQGEDDWIAGSAISWRRLMWPDGAIMPVGIMSGSWTLPGARGKGCFSTLVEESRQWTKERGGGALLAFVTHDNASRRRLEAAGSTMVPTCYVLSTPQTPDLSATTTACKPAFVTDVSLASRLYEAAQDAAGVQFGYAGVRAWAGQFLERPTPTQVFEIEGLGHVITEETDTTLRALALLPREQGRWLELFEAAVGHAQRCEKVFFTYLSDPRGLKELEEFRLKTIDGFVTALVADESAWPQGRSIADLAQGLRIHNGDRM